MSQQANKKLLVMPEIQEMSKKEFIRNPKFKEDPIPEEEPSEEGGE